VAAFAACADTSEFRPLREGDDAPAWAAATLAGDSIAAPPAAGQPMLLNVWATWCAPCRQEMPGLQEVHERFGDRVRVVGVSVDHGDAGAVHRFIDELGITFAIVHDPAERVTRAFRTIAVPETFLMDATGRIRKRWTGGFDPTSADALALIEEVVAADRE
jgi:peroxiredoxin